MKHFSISFKKSQWAERSVQCTVYTAGMCRSISNWIAQMMAGWLADGWWFYYYFNIETYVSVLDAVPMNLNEMRS